MGESTPTSPGEFAKVPTYLWDYANDHSLLAKAAEELRRFLSDLANEASIPLHAVETRAKTLASYQAKSEKLEDDGAPKYTDPSTQIRDAVAARVIVFTMGARNDLADLIEQQTEVHERQNPGHKKHNGYDSEHFIITAVRDATAATRFPSLTRFLSRYPGFEVQLRSVAAHAWAEYEHDVRYKSGAYTSLAEVDRLEVDKWFVQASGMREYMDTIFDQIQNKLHPPESARDEPLIQPEDVIDDTPPREQAGGVDTLDADSLAIFIRGRYEQSEVGEPREVAEVVEQLEGLGIDTVGKVSAALAEIDSDSVSRLMDYPSEPSGARRLDDELLAAFGDRYADGPASDRRRQLLNLRLRRVNGRFAIYTISHSGTDSRAVTGARAVRDLARAVANACGTEAATVPDATSSDPTLLKTSTNPRRVETEHGDLYVASNLSREWAEDIMQCLLANAPGSGLAVKRAGDVLFEADSST